MAEGPDLDQLRAEAEGAIAAAGSSAELEGEAVRIEVGAESLNVAMAAPVALYEAAHRMPPHG